MRGKIFFGILLICASLISCKKKNETPTDDFDRASMLSNYCDNQILPGYAALETKFSVLNQKTIDFTTTIDLNTLTALKNQWKDCYVFWQTVKIYSFGASAKINLKQALSFFPVDTNQINNNINHQVSNLDSSICQNAIGLNAMDYLLYHSDENTILQEFSDIKRQNYLKQITAKMLTDVQLAKSAWTSYSSTFKSATGNDANSSLSIMVNEFNKDFELVKNAKISIPLGEKSLGIKRPDYVEARYSGIGFDLISSNLAGIKTCFQGGAGLGFDDYLNTLNKKVGEQLLSANIIAQFDAGISKSNSFSNTLEYAIMNNDAEVKVLYDLLQGIVPEIKTDMPSAFGVFITYNDTDGD